MRIVRLVVGAALVLAAAIAARQFDAPDAGEASASPVATSEKTDVYHLSASGHEGGNCSLWAGEPLPDGGRTMRFSQGCRAIDPGLAGDAVWRETSQGTAAILDLSGRPIVEFGMSDGAAYESFRPVVPIMILTAGG